MNESEIVGFGTLALLAAVLVIFLAGIARSARGRKPEGIDFGWGFSLFVVAWIVDEAVDLLSPPEWSDINELTHFLLLAAFAVWLNARLVWALRRAKSEEKGAGQ